MESNTQDKQIIFDPFADEPIEVKDLDMREKFLGEKEIRSGGSVDVASQRRATSRRFQERAQLQPSSSWKLKQKASLLCYMQLYDSSELSDAQLLGKFLLSGIELDQDLLLKCPSKDTSPEKWNASQDYFVR